MNRKEFINKLGIGAAFVLTSSCLGSCTRDTRELNNVDLCIDLNSSEFAELQDDGGYVIVEGIVVARTLDGDFVAATRTCSHEQLNDILFDADNNEWLCSSHGARFTMEGDGLNSNGSAGLSVYQVQYDVSTNALKIFS
jgi:nitrite reductase/ring-hydroxylating ferredoxin subunit